MEYVTKTVLLIIFALVHEIKGGVAPPPIFTADTPVGNAGSDPQTVTSVVPETYIANESSSSNETQTSAPPNISTTAQNDSYVDNNAQNTSLLNTTETASVNNSAAVGSYEAGLNNNQTTDMTASDAEGMSGTSYVTDTTPSSTNQSTDSVSSETFSLTDSTNTSESANMSSPEYLEQSRTSNNQTSGYQNDSTAESKNGMNFRITSNETVVNQTSADPPSITYPDNSTQQAVGNNTIQNERVISDMTSDTTTPDVPPSKNYTAVGSESGVEDTSNTTDISTDTGIFSQNGTTAEGGYIQPDTNTSRPNDTQIVFKQDNGTTTVEISLDQFDNASSLLGYAIGNETQTEPGISQYPESSAMDGYTTETVTESISKAVTEATSMYTEPSYTNRTEIPIITVITTTGRPYKPVTKAPMSSYLSTPNVGYTTEIYIPPVDLLTLVDPPPIFPGGRRPPTYEDDVAQSLGPFVTRPREAETQRPTTAEPPPPPIIVPRQQVSPFYKLPTRTTTQPPYKPLPKVFRTADPVPNPKYMTDAKLAEFVLKNLENSQRQMRKGVQVFFQTVRPLQFEREKTTTPPPYQVFKEPGVMGNLDIKQGGSMTSPPIVEPPKKFFDANFLLNQIVKNDAGGGKSLGNLQQPNVGQLLKQTPPNIVPANQNAFKNQPQLNLPQNRQQQNLEQQVRDREQQQKQQLQKLLKEHQAELQELQRRFEKENRQQPVQQQTLQQPSIKKQPLDRTGQNQRFQNQQPQEQSLRQQPPVQSLSQQSPQQSMNQEFPLRQQLPQSSLVQKQPQQSLGQQPLQQPQGQQLPQSSLGRPLPQSLVSQQSSQQTLLGKQPPQQSLGQQPPQQLGQQPRQFPHQDKQPLWRNEKKFSMGNVEQQQIRQQKEIVNLLPEQANLPSATKPFFDSSYLLKRIGLQPSNMQTSPSSSKIPSALSQEIPAKRKMPQKNGQKQGKQIKNELLSQQNNLLLSALNTESKTKRPRQMIRRRPALSEGAFTPYVRTGDLFEAQALEAWIKTKSLKPGLLQRVQNEKRTRLNKNPDVKPNPLINSKVNNNINVNQITNNGRMQQRNVANPFIGSKEKNNNINFDQGSDKIRMESPTSRQNTANAPSLQTNGLNQNFQRPSFTFVRPREPIYGNNPDNAFKKHSPLKELKQQASSNAMGQNQMNQGPETIQFQNPNFKPKIGLVSSPEGTNAMSKPESKPTEKIGRMGMIDIQQQFPLSERRGFETVLSDLSGLNNVNLNQLGNQINFRPNILNDIGPKNIIPARTIAESESHWSSKVGNSIKLPSDQVPYFMKTDPGQTITTTPAQQYTLAEFNYNPLQQQSIREYPSSPPPLTEPPIAYITATTLPTVSPTADPNPPPIFDTKVMQTFMPFPKPEVTIKPRYGEATTPSSDAQEYAKGFDNRCTGCVFVNDRCLLPDDVHCNMFIECVRQGAMVRAFNKECALGSFFDRKSYLCVDPKNADCPQDRCREPGTKWYPVHGHCKHYWSCTSREGGGVYAQSECCPDMGGFDPNVGCVENKECKESCGSVVVKNVTEGCHLTKTASPKVYFDTNANLERPCAPGTVFIDRQCTCVRDVTVERSDTQPGAAVCSPMLAITFENDTVVDTSVHKQHIGNEGIAATQTGEGIFKGAGRLILWRYANLMFPIVFAVRFRFLSTSDAPRFQSIISNCDPKSRRPSTFDISLDTMFSEVVFKVDTLESGPKQFKQMYQKETWTTVVLIYDGERIVGSVDNRARNIKAPGGIETRPTPFSVGACVNRPGFKGLLDDLSIFEDCIPDDMYGIFMSVLE